MQSIFKSKKLILPLSVIATLLSITTPTLASVTAQEAKDPWAGSTAQIGGTINTGNTENSSLTGMLNLSFSKMMWKNTFNLSGQYGKDSGILSSKNLTISNVYNYSLSKNDAEKNYISQKISYKIDKFSAYDYESLLSLGYGRDWVHNDVITVSTTLGPGYRRNGLADSDEVDDEIIADSTFHACWNIQESLKLTEDVSDSYGSEYNLLSAVTAVTSTVYKQIAVSLSYKVDTYSSIPADSTYTEKTNTLTTFNLVYPI